MTETAMSSPLGIQSDRRLALAIYLASTLTVMAGGLVAPTLALLEAELGAGQSSGSLSIRLVLTLPALFTALSALTAALMSDRFGRRRLLVWSLLLYGFAGLLGSMANSLAFLLLTRAMLGISVGGLMTATLAIIADSFGGERRLVVLGRQAAFMGIGGIVFAAIGGALALISWRAPFMLYSLSLALVPFVLISIPPDRARADRLSRPQLARRHWIMVAVLAGCAFAAMAGFYLTPAIAPFLMVKLGEPSPFAIGIIIALASTASAAASVSYRRVRMVLTPMTIFAVSFAIMSCSYAIVWSANSPGWATLGFGMFGVGLGMTLPNLGGWVSETLEEDLRSPVIGLVTMALFFGQFLSPILAEPVIRQTGIVNTFGIASLALLAICVVIFTVSRVVTRAVQGSAT